MKLLESNSTETSVIKYGSLILVFLMSIYEILNNREKWNKFKSIFTNRRWMKHFGFLITFVFSMFFLYPVRSHEREATKKALTAFIIAIFASIDLTIAPFWIIWVLSYSFDNWV